MAFAHPELVASAGIAQSWWGLCPIHQVSKLTVSYGHTVSHLTANDPFHHLDDRKIDGGFASALSQIHLSVMLPCATFA